MKVIRFLFGKCGNTLLGKILYVLMIGFMITCCILILSNTDFTDPFDILWGFWGFLLFVGVFRGLYYKFLQQFERNHSISEAEILPAKRSMQMIQTVFGRCGQSRFSKIIYCMMILYVILSFVISLIFYTDITVISDLFILLLGTLANITVLRIFYKNLFLKNNRIKK